MFDSCGDIDEKIDTAVMPVYLFWSIKTPKENKPNLSAPITLINWYVFIFPKNSLLFPQFIPIPNDFLPKGNNPDVNLVAYFRLKGIKYDLTVRDVTMPLSALEAGNKMMS